MPASNINHVVLTGNLTQDPDLRETGSGTPVCELRIACNTSIKRDGNWEQKANYFQVNAWGGMGKNCKEWLSKGSKVGIDGRLDWQMWEDKKEAGKTNSRVVIIAQSVEFLDTRKKGEGKPKTEDTESTEKEDDIPF